MLRNFPSTSERPAHVFSQNKSNMGRIYIPHTDKQHAKQATDCRFAWGKHVQNMYARQAYLWFYFRSLQPGLALFPGLLSGWKFHLVLIWMSGLFEASAVGSQMDHWNLKAGGPEQQDVSQNEAEIWKKIRYNGIGTLFFARTVAWYDISCFSLISNESISNKSVEFPTSFACFRRSELPWWTSSAHPTTASTAAEVTVRCTAASGVGGSGSKGDSSKRGTVAGLFCEGIGCTITKMRRKPSHW